MRLVFDQHVNSIQLNAHWINNLDLSNDGSMIAIAYIPENDEAGVRLYQTKDSQLIGEWGTSQAGQGVAFDEEGQALYFLLRENDGDVKLQKIVLTESEPQILASYGSKEGIHSLQRSLDSRWIAVLGSAVEIWDMSNSAVVRFRESNSVQAKVRACFNRSGSRLYVYGLNNSEILALDVANNRELKTWVGPASYGQQLIVSPSEDFIVAVAQGDMGVFIYDLRSEQRFQPETYNENFFTELFLFSFDNSLMITLETNLRGQHLTDNGVITGPELISGFQTAAAFAWEAPLIAYAIKNQVFWLRLLEQS